MFDALYYLFLTVFYLLLFFKIDVLNLRGDFIYIFFSEMAANFALYCNVFVIKFNRLSFLRNDKKYIIEVVTIYLFFLVFGGGFYYFNSLPVPLVFFTVSLLGKFFRLNSQKSRVFVEENFKTAALQLSFFFVAILVALFFYSMGYSDTAEIFWGVTYSALTFFSLVVQLYKSRIKCAEQ